MLSEVILFIVGLVLLVKGSDFFVRSSATIAKRFGISEFIIGLTFVAVGSSLPELASAIAASIKHDSGLIMGNIVGANIVNIGLVVGIGALLMKKIKIKDRMVKRDGYIMFFTSLLFFFLAIDGMISRVEAALLLLLYLAYLVYVMEAKVSTKEKDPFMDFIKYFFKMQYLVTIRSRIMRNVRNLRDGIKNGSKKHITPSEKKQISNLFVSSIIKDVLIILISLAAIGLGAKYLVKEAQFFASALGVPSTLIGITLIAFGTTLPELSITIAAARKKYSGMAIGNILGSNIVNILLIIGVSGLISPLSVLKQTIYLSIPIMLVMSMILIGTMKTEWQITRREGVMLIATYIIALVAIIISYSI